MVTGERGDRIYLYERWNSCSFFDGYGFKVILAILK